MKKFSNRELIDETAEALFAHGLPVPEEFVLTRGASTVSHGIREAHPAGDIDAVMCLENHQFVERELGFRAVPMVVGTTSDGKERTVTARRDAADRFDLHRWEFSMYLYNRLGRGRVYLPELGAMSDVDPETGIRVARPELVLLTNLESGEIRHDEDNQLIIEYLEETGFFKDKTLEQFLGYCLKNRKQPR